MKDKISMVIQLFWLFMKIGPVTFGGGYAMMALVEREVVTKRSWLNEREISDLFSVAGSAPGGVAVNVAAFIGYRLAGALGATAAVIGIALPTFAIVLALSLSYSAIEGHPLVESALKGIHAAIIGLIAVAAHRMMKSALFDKTTVAVSLAALVLLIIFHLNPIYIILCGLVIGIIIVNVKKKLGIPVQTEKPSGAAKKEKAASLNTKTDEQSKAKIQV
ncbi:chromate transporter [Paenibacillus sp. GXUN7292]|uniref:chromate transporter n=1 Tax=Paenibacillus sp. GXUN7292 TaxID=3422499 RepID=UPI003D7C36B3